MSELLNASKDRKVTTYKIDAVKQQRKVLVRINGKQQWIQSSKTTVIVQ